LAARIVGDFHSAEAAAKAGEDWAKQFQKDEVPDVIELVQIKLDDVKSRHIQSNQWQIRMDKLLLKAGFADSVTDANRKLKQGSVQVDGRTVAEVWSSVMSDGPPFDVRVGRILKRVHIIP